MAKNVGALLILGTLFVVAGAVAAPKAKVPGVRGGPAAAGGPTAGVDER
jgi:hypothetical protein